MSQNDRFFAAVCTHCHTKSSFDKSEVCSQSSSALNKTTEQFYVTCPNCGKRFKVEIDCEGYQ